MNKHFSSNLLEKDFNSIFWKIFGVNHRVYQALDAINIKRDKQADEQIYHSYLSNDDLLSNNSYALFKSKEVDNFYELFISYLIGQDENTIFYIHQICNIIYNFNIFKTTDLNYDYIKLFSFQTAFIIEYMSHHHFDTKLFDVSIKEESIMPFIDFSKKVNKIKSNKHFATIMNYTLEEKCSEIHNNIQTNIESVTEFTFQKNISKWKNKIELPSLISLFIITNTLYKNKKDRDNKIAFFFQLLLIRGLLHIKKTFNIDDHTKDSFLKNFRYFRKQIKLKLNSNAVGKLQAKYLIELSESIDLAKSSENLNEIYKKIITFSKNYITDDEPLQIEFLNRDEITNLFNEKKYEEAFSLIDFKNNHENELIQQTINRVNYLLQFIISTKLEDKKMMQKYFKEFDRYMFGGILSFQEKRYNSQEFIELLKDVNTLKDCINKMMLHVKTNYQI